MSVYAIHIGQTSAAPISFENLHELETGNRRSGHNTSIKQFLVLGHSFEARSSGCLWAQPDLERWLRPNSTSTRASPAEEIRFRTGTIVSITRRTGMNLRFLTNLAGGSEDKDLSRLRIAVSLSVLSGLWRM